MTVELETPRMLVRTLRPSDRREWIRVFAASEVQNKPWFPLRTDEFDTLFDRQLARVAAGDVKCIGVLPDSRIACFVNLNELVRGPFQNAYAGWSVNAEVARQGFATEGVKALLRIAFTEAGLHRVQANVIPRNARSVRVAEKAGFRFEGIAKRYVKINGEWEDHAMYAMTTEEWSALPAE